MHFYIISLLYFLHIYVHNIIICQLMLHEARLNLRLFKTVLYHTEHTFIPVSQSNQPKYESMMENKEGRLFMLISHSFQYFPAAYHNNS